MTQATEDLSVADLNIWLCDLTYTQQAVSADLIPQAIGGIALFTEAQLPCLRPVRLFKYPEKLIDMLESGEAPDIIGFSNYVWNSSLSRAFAAAIKKRRPATITVLGGPHYPIVPAEQENFLRACPEVDFYVIKEGELAFANLVQALANRRFDKRLIHGTLGSVHSIDEYGKAHLPAIADRLTDLTVIPSPYTTGRLDEFFDGKLLPIIQTNRGCPFSCTFCVEGVSYYNKIYKNSQDKVEAEIDYIGRKMKETRTRGGRNDLFIADSNFGMYKDDIDTCRAIARAQSAYQWPDYINVATGKNQKERVLAAAKLINGALRLSGSVQSLDPEVLQNIKRNNIAPDRLMSLALDAAEIGANSYSEVILGLPGDSKERHLRTLRTIIEAGFNMVSTFQLMMLPGSEMCSEESKQKYKMELRFRIFPRCYGEYRLFGERLVTAEVEEVCVANSTMSFDDYLDCRRLHLLIALFHNDGVFGTLLKFLRANKVSVFRWLEILLETPPPAGLGDLFQAYVAATRQELWEDRDALEAFIRAPGTIQRYIDGQLGNNLLFTYKSMAMASHVEALAEMADRSIRRLLEETALATSENIAFVEDALAFHRCRLEGIFSDRDHEPTALLRYDLPRYDETAAPPCIEDFLLRTPRHYRFALSAAQKDLLARYLSVFGSTPHGVGRMLTKVYVRRLLRQGFPIEDVSPLIMARQDNARAPFQYLND